MAHNGKTIRFSLRENKLVSGETAPFTACVHGYKTVGQEEIISTMAGMNASVSRQEILSVLDLLKTVIRDILLSGDRVATDLFNARVSISGGFDSAESDYSAGMNGVTVRMSPAAFLKKQVADKARVEKIRGKKSVPELDSVYDYASLSKNSFLTSGHTAEVKGANLDCDEGVETEGLYLADNTAVLHKATVIHQKTNSRIVFQVPELVKGTYRLVLRRGFGSELREGRLNAEISVN